ncbi:hypothetical protein D9757_010583 [Collybiopsis confluens]|uniref:Uncharacterized protein n=1 Tax=Collybiopsis confluens TaxID=2823264 RepID=A0A8H5GVL8_9AGAR|nr:hypothetical protein D9757_010583 [Collybiopsis confluens]
MRRCHLRYYLDSSAEPVTSVAKQSADSGRQAQQVWQQSIFTDVKLENVPVKFRKGRFTSKVVLWFDSTVFCTASGPV